MFGLQIPSCLQWTGSILDEKGRKGLLWQRGLWTVSSEPDCLVDGFRCSLTFSFMEWDKELCHQIMWVKCFDISRWKASHTIQSVILLLPSAEVIAILNHTREGGVPWLPTWPISEQKLVDLGRERPAPVVGSVPLRGHLTFQCRDISHPGPFASYFRRRKIQPLPLLRL